MHRHGYLQTYVTDSIVKLQFEWFPDRSSSERHLVVYTTNSDQSSSEQHLVVYDLVHTGSNRLASNSSKRLHLAARAHVGLVCVAAMGS